MKQELTTILDAIGTDEEVGTHGAVPRYIALSRYIQNAGSCDGEFEGKSQNKEEYRKSMPEAIPMFNALSTPAFMRLVLFAEDLGFIDHSLGEKIKRAYVLPQYCPEQIEKRALFLQYFSQVKPMLFTLEELEEEKEVKQNSPWRWIGALKNINMQKSLEETPEVIIKTKNVAPLILSIDHYQSKGYGIEHIKKIMEKVQDRIPLDKYSDLEEAVKRRTS